jgi:hypothetical protein
LGGGPQDENFGLIGISGHVGQRRNEHPFRLAGDAQRDRRGPPNFAGAGAKIAEMLAPVVISGRGLRTWGRRRALHSRRPVPLSD